MARKHYPETDRSYQVNGQNQSDPQAKAENESSEDLGIDLEESSALLSRYGFEIRVGLGVLGVLGFLFAAVVVYRMVTLREEDGGGSKPQETAQVTEPKEAAGKSPRESSEQGQGPQEVATPRAAFGLDFPASNTISSQQSIQSGAGVAGDGRYASAAGSAWSVPPGDPLAGEATQGMPSRFEQVPSVPENDFGMNSSYATLPPASPIADKIGNSVPGQPFAPDATFQPSQPGDRSNNPSLPGNRESNNIPDFFAESDSSQELRGVSGVPTPTQAGTRYDSLPANSGFRTEPPFPGDFFSGAPALSSRGNPSEMPSPLNRAGESSGNTVADSWPQQAVRTASNAGTTPAISAASSAEMGDVASGLPFSGSTTAGMGSPPGATPYAPPLTAGRFEDKMETAVTDEQHVMYTVQEGETLFDIARERLGKASRWVDIYQLNRAQLGERLENFRPGLTLRLPAESFQPAAASGATLR
ncbi:MAG: hypothetical protein ACUVQG_03285 [Thermogutta sp.]